MNCAGVVGGLRRSLTRILRTWALCGWAVLRWGLVRTWCSGLGRYHWWGFFWQRQGGKVGRYSVGSDDRQSSSSTPDSTKVASGDGRLTGRTLEASGFQSVAIGVGATATGEQAAALGSGGAGGDRSFAVGGTVAVGADQGIAIGDQASVTAAGGIAIGGIVEATAAGAIAIGDNETAAGGLGAIVIGSEARGVGVYSVAIWRSWRVTKRIRAVVLFLLVRGLCRSDVTLTRR